MRYPIFSFGLMLLMAGCSKQGAGHSGSERQAANEQNKAAAMAFASPEFSVSVRLSDAANRKLIDSKETIMVEGFLSGHPKNATELRPVFLGRVEAEIHPSETATFNDLRLTPDALARIDSHGPRILIIVSSGKLSTDNLLACEVYDGNFELINGRTIDIPCQLIEERLPRQGIEISPFHSKPSAAAREREVSEEVIISPREQCQRLIVGAGRPVLEGTNIAKNADAQLDGKEIDPAGRKRRGPSDQRNQQVRQLALNPDL